MTIEFMDSEVQIDHDAITEREAWTWVTEMRVFVDVSFPVRRHRE